MTEHVLRHPTLKSRRIVVRVPNGGTLSPEYERAGWVLDKKTDPADVPPVTATAEPPAEPVTTKKGH